MLHEFFKAIGLILLETPCMKSFKITKFQWNTRNSLERNLSASPRAQASLQESKQPSTSLTAFSKEGMHLGNPGWCCRWLQMISRPTKWDWILQNTQDFIPPTKSLFGGRVARVMLVQLGNQLAQLSGLRHHGIKKPFQVIANLARIHHNCSLEMELATTQNSGSEL